MGKNKDERIDKKHNNEKRPSKVKNKIIIIAIIAAIVATLAVVSHKLDIASTTKADNVPLVDAIECDIGESLVFHIHAHLDIFVNGNPIIVPAFIGINDNTCLYWLHTHTPDGVIHIEAPQEKVFTLGQFFDIWKSTSTGMPPTDSEPIIYVNGQAVTTSLKDTSLHAHDEIVLVYGNPPTNIPSFYQFPEGE
jgi:hypothetical protein